MKVFLCNFKRTPIISFLSKQSNLSSIDLAKICVEKTINNNLKNNIDCCIFGNVLSAGNGQNIARQIAINSGLSNTTNSYTINMVCSSGMEAIINACRMIKLREKNMILVGGTESMSNSPLLLKNHRTGKKFGEEKLLDSMMNDGLTDAFSNKHMGVLADDLAKELDISREKQDDYAIRSYTLSNEAHNNGYFDEIVEFDGLKYDEEIKNFMPDKLKKLKTVFNKDGTITPGNASTLSDGACSMIIANEESAGKYGLDILAEILDYDEYSQDPNRFTESPSFSIKKIIDKNNLNVNDIDFFEINEAFATVPLICHKNLDIPIEKINIWGGAISLGHPIGCSGARIVGTLGNILKKNNKIYGVASICNGGGGATSILLKNNIK